VGCHSGAIMANGTAFAPVLAFGVPAGRRIVVAGRAIRVQIDRSCPPIGGDFPAMATDVAAGSIHVVGSGPIRTVITGREGQVNGAVVGRGLVTDGTIGTDRADCPVGSVSAGSVRERGAVRWLRMANGAVTVVGSTAVINRQNIGDGLDFFCSQRGEIAHVADIAVNCRLYLSGGAPRFGS